MQSVDMIILPSGSRESSFFASKANATATCTNTTNHCVLDCIGNLVKKEHSTQQKNKQNTPKKKQKVRTIFNINIIIENHAENTCTCYM